MRLKLLQGDCLELLQTIPDASIDMVLADPPYGVTACKWDTVIPLEPLWEQIKRVTKPQSAIVMTASQPFTTTLIASNLKMFKYEWVWEKEQGTMPMIAPYQPLKVHEQVVVFSRMAASYSKRGNMNYFPQKTTGHAAYKAVQRISGNIEFHSDPSGYHFKDNDGTRYPRSVQFFRTERDLPHASQKPVALMEYMIKTYTNEGDRVLDFCMGSGTTGVACVNLRRHFIGIEKDPEFFELAKSRILRQ